MAASKYTIFNLPIIGTFVKTALWASSGVSKLIVKCFIHTHTIEDYVKQPKYL